MCLVQHLQLDALDPTLAMFPMATDGKCGYSAIWLAEMTAMPD